MKGISIIGAVISAAILTVTLSSCGWFDGDGNVLLRTADYFPLGQGDTWTYDSEVTSEGDSWQETVTKTVSGTETIKGVEAAVLTEDDGDYSLYTSDDNGVTLYAEHNVKDSGWERLEYDPPLNLLPGEIYVGLTKSSSATLTYTTSDGLSLTGTYSVELTVEGIEDVTVPAGTFEDCLRVRFTGERASSDGNSETFAFTTWLAKGVGDVKSAGRQTATVDGQTTVATFKDELASATVGGVSY